MDHYVITDREEGPGRRIEWWVYPPYYEDSMVGLSEMYHVEFIYVLI